MLPHRKSWLTAALLVLGCLVLSGALVSAGEKKNQEEKKKALASKFVGKAIELKLKDGKLERAAELDQDDPKAFGRFHYKVFTVQLEKGKSYRIDQRGAADDPKFDPYLFLEDGNGVQLEADGDSGGGLNARIVYKAAKTGPYRIVATAFVPGQTGKFTLAIGAANAQEAKLAELKFQLNSFASLPAAQRKELADQVAKYLAAKNGDLTVPDFQLAFMLGIEAEIVSVDLARDVYKEAIKHFAAAKNGDLSTATTRQLEAALKGLDMIGKTFEIAGKTVAGKDFDLKNMKGKVVLIDFWATWCGPCIAEMPNMEAAYKKYHGKGFDIIGVSLDKTDDKISAFTEARKIPWPSINVEDSRKLADRYEVNAIPFPVLVDAQGRVVSLRARGPQLERLLEKLLGEKK